MNLIYHYKKIYTRYLPFVTAVLFIFLLLTNPLSSTSLVNTGLTTWYKYMIPSLFPFMVLSGILLRSGLSYQISAIFNPLLGKLFRLSPDCIYVIIMGFLCGFPMGASIIADSLSLGRISRREADLLLTFCNNIGPIYFISFVTVTCPYYPLPLTLSIMYLVPLLYGLILRYTSFKDIPDYNIKRVSQLTNQAASSNYLTVIQDSIQKSLISIITLGGYMIIFNVLQLPLYNSFYQLPDNLLCIFKGFIEINSGITAIKSYPNLYTIAYSVFLPFGGLCCIFQTYSMIKDTPLSLRSYLVHKLAQTGWSALVYSLVSRWI